MDYCYKKFKYFLQYGIVLDAGSSHTSLFIYKWDGEKQKDTALARQTHTCKVAGTYFNQNLSCGLVQPNWSISNLGDFFLHFIAFVKE